MAKAAKSTRKPAKAKKAVGTKKAARKKVVSKKKASAKATVSSRKKPARKKVAAKKKVAVKKKASPKKAASSKRKPAKAKAQVEMAKPKAPAVTAPVTGMAVAKPTKSRLIKAQTADVQVELLPPVAPPLVAEPQTEESLLRVGQMAPDFELRADDGSIVALSDFHGRKVVLYFYPKDDTPGCTVEACSFRDGLVEIEERGAVVLGVSVDPVESHQMFRDKLGINFPLLSDENKQVVQAYGVWKERTHDGRTYMTTERTTFVIGEDGRIAKIFPKVQVHGHFEEVLAVLWDGPVAS